MVMVMSGAFLFSVSHVIVGIIRFGGLIIVPLSIFGFVITSADANDWIAVIEGRSSFHPDHRTIPVH